MNNSNDDLEALIRSASPAGHRCELIPVTITPEMAKGYLSFGVEQEREIDQSVIDDYALSMQDGEWKAGSILIFSEDYKIIDGYIIPAMSPQAAFFVLLIAAILPLCGDSETLIG
jgi:hypothetical protein